MIIVQAHIWPHGDHQRSFEALTATIANRGGAYFSHVRVRPFMHVKGFEADLTISDFNRDQTVDKIISAALRSANFPLGLHPIDEVNGYAVDVHKKLDLSLTEFVDGRRN